MPGKTKCNILRSGELARLAGVSPDTLRHYERIGVLLPLGRSQNGYREYSLQSLETVRQIQRALQVGFTLTEMAQIFRIRKNGGVPCGQVRAMAAAKLAGIESQISELLTLRDELRAVLNSWDETLAKTPDGERAELLRQLGVTLAPKAKTSSPLTPKWRRASQPSGKQKKGKV